MISILLLCICSKEEVDLEIDEPILNRPSKEQGGLFTIYGDDVFEASHILERSMYLSLF